MTEQEVLVGVTAWVSLRTGLTAIRDFEEGPRPDRPYIGVHLQSARQLSRERMNLVRTVTAGTGTVEAYALVPWEWNFAVNAYGGGSDATAPLRRLMGAIRLMQMREPLYPDLNPNETSGIRRLREKVNQRWENRAQMDLIVLGSLRETFDINVITETESPVITPAGQ